MKRIKYTLWVIGITLMVSTVVAFKATDRFEVVKNMDIFYDLFNEVNKLYVDEVQPGELMKEGIDNMLESLDPYTVYYPESDIEDYKLMTTGQYGGIGARIAVMDKKHFVTELFEETPATKAGMEVGDQILSVDGKKIKEEDSYQLSKLLKGSPGSEVVIEVLKNSTQEKKELKFRREEITISSVPYYGMLNDSVGYLKLNSFTHAVSSEVRDAVVELKQNHGIEKMVLDLRGNPGGLLMESVNIVNLFTPKGEVIVETRGKVKQWNKQYKNINKSIDEKMKLVVLVDGGSASASEIVSGSLQDLDRAVILGENTYGKGLVQTTVKLKYNSSLKVTTAKYYIPSGRCIQELNYAKKDEDGNAEKTPDSLIVKFKTRNGREVEDGHGIQPDVQHEAGERSYIVNGLLRNHHFFYFVNKEFSKYQEVKSAKSFEVSDQLFEDFMKYLNKQEDLYESETELTIDDLAFVAKEDSLSDLLGEQIEAMKNLVKQNKMKTILKFENAVKQELKNEILTRKFFESGRIQGNLSSDDQLIKALEILGNSVEYNRILGKN